MFTDTNITEPDKGSGVVVKDKAECLLLLADVSINNVMTLKLVDPERRTNRGKPPKYYHPFLLRRGSHRYFKRNEKKKMSIV